MTHFMKDATYYSEKEEKMSIVIHTCWKDCLFSCSIFAKMKNHDEYRLDWLKYNIYSVKISWHTTLFLQNSDEQCVVLNSSSKLH